ncbi:restriction endonuclease subunit S [Prevotella sp.]
MANSSDTPHYEHINFALPKNWQLSTLGEVFYMHAGKNIVASEISSNADETYRYKCIGGNGLRGYVQQFNTEGSFPIIGRQGALCGNINYVEGRFYATEHAVVVDTFCKTNVKWAFYFLIKLNLNQYATATAQPGLSVNTICDVQIPLPPLTEQQRIVAEIERWFALIDTVEQGKADLQTAIKQTKSKILDLAIHGKLVPQDPNDEPVSELLKRINPKAQITCDNEHSRKLPYNWCLCNLGDVCMLENGFAFSSDQYKAKGIPLIRISNIKDNEISLSSCVFINEGYEEKYIVHSGDLLIAMSGATTGKMGIYNQKYVAYLNQRVGNIKIVDSNLLFDKYRNYFLFSQKNKILELAYGGAQPNISGKVINSLFVPLPPIAEQKRIVQKIEVLFSIIDTVEQALQA